LVALPGFAALAVVSEGVIDGRQLGIAVLLSANGIPMAYPV